MYFKSQPCTLQGLDDECSDDGEDESEGAEEGEEEEEKECDVEIEPNQDAAASGQNGDTGTRGVSTVPAPAQIAESEGTPAPHKEKQTGATENLDQRQHVETELSKIPQNPDPPTVPATSNQSATHARVQSFYIVMH